MNPSHPGRGTRPSTNEEVIAAARADGFEFGERLLPRG